MENTQIFKLVLAFAVIVIFLWKKRPLYQAMLASILAVCVLYFIHPLESLLITYKVITDWSALSLLLIIYLITFLQRLLEKRSQIELAQKDLNGIFNNRRINASIGPLFIGLLPSAAAMILCGDIVKKATDGYLDKKEQAFVTSWFRHIPKSTLPTYSGVLLMLTIANVKIAGFMLAMIPPVIVMFLLGYFLYLRKLPTDTGTPVSQNKWLDVFNLFKHLWSLLLILLLIIIFKLSVVLAVSIVILLALFVYKMQLKELQPMFKSAFEARMIGNTFLVLLFKEFISFTGVINYLPEFFGQFPVPLYIVFSLLFFFGGVVSGTNGIIALGTTMAITAMPNSGIPLMVLLMSMCHAASQISPTHVCLAVVTEYFDVTLGEVVRKTLPAITIFILFMLVYYNILLQIF